MNSFLNLFTGCMKIEHCNTEWKLYFSWVTLLEKTSRQEVVQQGWWRVYDRLIQVMEGATPGKVWRDKAQCTPLVYYVNTPPFIHNYSDVDFQSCYTLFLIMFLFLISTGPSALLSRKHFYFYTCKVLLVFHTGKIP